jgi:hypothetical protein
MSNWKYESAKLDAFGNLFDLLQDVLPTDELMGIGFQAVATCCSLGLLPPAL